MQNFFFSLFNARDNKKTAEASTGARRPTELGAAELERIGGGFGPAGTWAAESSSVQGPAGSW